MSISVAVYSIRFGNCHSANYAFLKYMVYAKNFNLVWLPWWNFLPQLNFVFPLTFQRNKANSFSLFS